MIPSTNTRQCVSEQMKQPDASDEPLVPKARDARRRQGGEECQRRY